MPALAAQGALDLGERFHLIELLGQGTFGRVYEAIDRRYGMTVALKLLSGFHPEALRHFKDEFRALAHVSHPNVVTLYELHHHEGAWFYTMEHVPGTTLSSWASETQRSPDELRGALLGFASGISALHDAGLLHRDIKPSNVLCSPEGRVAVGDFGHIGALDPTRGAMDERVIATVAYSAPEVWQGRPIGPASDWFSFGVAAFQLLTGKLPYDSVPARTERDGPAPSTRQPGIAPDLDELTARLLRRDPDARPTAPEILSVLAGRSEPRTGTFATAARLVGRDRELEALAVALEDTRSAGSAVHLVVGPSGIGKTSLVEEVARRARRHGGALVLRGRCHPQDSLSARGLDGVIDALGRHVARASAPRRASLVPDPEPALARMFPTLGDVLPPSRERPRRGTTGKEERQAALGGLVRLFSRVAAEAPVLVVIDDVQWADEETGAVLLALALGLRAAPGVLFVATARDDLAETSPVVEQLRRAGIRLVEHPLHPLGTGDAEALARTMLGDDAGRIGEVLDAAQGNPYLLVEVAAHLRTSEPPPPGASEEALVDRVLGSRVARLSPTARRMLEVLTLVEIPMPADVAMEAASLAESDYLGDLTTLRASRLVSPRLAAGRESLEPYHGRVREAVARSIAPASRPALHRAIASAFERSSSEAPEVVARHWFAAGEPRLALEHARAAATAARQAFAFARSASMLRLAKATGAARKGEALEIQLELADALANAGHGREAAAEFLALATLEPERAHLFERRAAEQLLFSGHIREGVEVLDRVLGRFSLALPRSRVVSVARVLWSQAFGPGRRVLGLDVGSLGAGDASRHDRIDALNAATLGLTMTDPLASAVMQGLHLDEAIRCSDPERLARALGIHMVHSAGGWYEPERTRILAEKCDALIADSSSPQSTADIALARAGAAWMEGRYAACLADADAALALLRRSSCVGMQWHIDTHHVMELEILEAMGRWDELATRLGPYLLDARERGDRFLEANLRSRARPTVLLAEGRPAEARAELALAREVWEQREFDLVALYGGLRAAACDLYEGEAMRAKETMDALWSEMQRSLLVRIVFYRDLGAAMRGTCLVAAARASEGGARRSALRELRSIEKGLRATSAPLPQAYAGLLAAGAASAGGRPDAAEQYAKAAEAFDALEARLLAEACRWRAEGSPAEATVLEGARLAEPARIYAMLTG